MSVLFGCSYLFHAPFAIRVMVTSSFLSPTGTSAGIRLSPSQNWMATAIFIHIHGSSNVMSQRLRNWGNGHGAVPAWLPHYPTI
jgi:hypothetical protein